jgi:hypothetical protein
VGGVGLARPYPHPLDIPKNLTDQESGGAVSASQSNPKPSEVRSNMRPVVTTPFSISPEGYQQSTNGVMLNGLQSPQPVKSSSNKYSKRYSQQARKFLEEDMGFSDSDKEKDREQRVRSFSIPEVGDYHGQAIDAMPHGYGTLKMQNGDIYVGEFYQGAFDGQGKLTSSSGCIYEGSWIQNLRDGSGHEKWPDGKQYEGDFKADKKHGYGSLQSLTY